MEELPYRLEKTNKQDSILIRVVGRLESGPLNQLANEIIGTNNAKLPKVVYLDFHELKYISSIGIRMLLDLQNNLKKSESKLVLIAIPPSVAQVFQLLGLLQAFQHFETLDEAESHKNF